MADRTVYRSRTHSGCIMPVARIQYARENVEIHWDELERKRASRADNRSPNVYNLSNDSLDTTVNRPLLAFLFFPFSFSLPPFLSSSLFLSLSCSIFFLFFIFVSYILFFSLISLQNLCFIHCKKK